MRSFFRFLLTLRQTAVFYAVFAASVGFAIESETNLFQAFNKVAFYTVQSIGVGFTDEELVADESFVFEGLNKETVGGIPNNKSPIILTISQKEFDNSAYGISPIDRCYMASKISSISKQSPEFLFIDYDLSPLVNPNSDYMRCQSILDDELVKTASKTKLLLVVPLINTDNPHIKEWVVKMVKSGVGFTNAYVNQELGVVISQGNDIDTPARLINQAVGNEISEAGLINFNQLEISPSDKSIKGSVVLFGGIYGGDDVFTTPFSTSTPGVYIHALDYATYHKSIHSSGFGEFGINLLDWGMDIAIALIFLIFVRFAFVKYKDWGRRGGIWKEMQFVWVLLFILPILFVLIVAAFWFTGYMVLSHQIWVEPVPIMIGIFIDWVIHHEKMLRDKDIQNVENVLSDSKYTVEHIKSLIMYAVILYYPFAYSIIG